MKPVLTASEMKQWDMNTINDIGIPSMVLMERASLAIAAKCAEKCQDDKEHKRILAVCGSGNNGGDGACAARILHMWGYQADVFIFGNPTRFSQEMEAQLNICRKAGIEILDNVPEFSKYTVIIDAIFGIGLCRDVRDPDGIIQGINESGAYVISADIPSGICADDGQVLGTAVEADETVTMQALKRGHLLYPGASYAGQVTVADIGIQPIGELISAYSMEESDLELIPKRKDRSNKGSYGKLLVVAGSLNMSGASYLSAAAAMKMGCGMVKILTVEENREILQRMLPEAMLDTYQDADNAVEGLRKNLKWADAVVMGPGLGQSEEAHALVTTMLKEGNLPLVLDADGLNCLDGELGLLKAFDQPCLITPHPGEMSRLSGKSIREILSQMIQTATDISTKAGVYCLLKDAGTVNACPDGLIFINASGNHGMATAGSGDVLSGIAGGLMCRGLEASYIGALAAYIHGMAGDRAAEKIGCDGMMASDMLNEIAAILKEYFS